MRKFAPYFIAIVFFALFAYRGVLALDPDFGWHLKYGEMILERGIVRTEPFSFTMPTYQIVDHEWSTNALFYLLYSSGGRLYVSLFTAFIAALSIISFYKKESLVSFLPLALLSYTLLLKFAGARTQVITWLFLGILINILYSRLKWDKYKYYLPAFFLLWANLHGAFAAGVFILVFYKGLQFIIEKKLDKKDLSIILSSILLTFVNPYGVHLWLESLRQFSDSGFYRTTIQEWMPIFWHLDFVYLFFASLSYSLVYKYRVKLRFEALCTSVVLFYMSFFTSRHVPLWVIATLPLAIESMHILYTNVVSEGGIHLKRAQKVFKIFLIFILLLCSLQTVFTFWSSLSMRESVFYPTKAVNYLEKIDTHENVFAPYGWGGYLIWKLPQSKVYIDGRMPSMKRDFDVEGESKWAFWDYLNTVNGESDFQTEAEKYDISMFLWYSKPQPERGIYVFIEYLSALFGGKVAEDEFLLLERVKELGWERIYLDDTAVIYKNPNR